MACVGVFKVDWGGGQHPVVAPAIDEVHAPSRAVVVSKKHSGGPSLGGRVVVPVLPLAGAVPPKFMVKMAKSREAFFFVRVRWLGLCFERLGNLCFCPRYNRCLAAPKTS